MVKLEENYRSTSNILGAANELIKSNTDRIDKVLKATRRGGEKAKIICRDDAKEEAEAVINKIETLSSLSEKELGVILQFCIEQELNLGYLRQS